MRRRGFAAVLILFASVLMLAIGAGARADAATSGIQGEKIVIGESPVTVVVTNDGPAADIAVQVSELFDANGTKSVATLTPDWTSASLTPAATKSLTLSINGWDRKAALTGSVAVITTTHDAMGVAEKPTIARTPVEVTPGGTIAPGATSWSVDSYKRSFGVREGPYGEAFPLADGASCPQDGASIDVLLTSGHQTAKATLTCAPNAHELSISLRDFNGAGTYSAKVPVGAVTLDLSVRRSIAWPEPLLWLALGLAIAIVRSFWVATGRVRAARQATYDHLRQDAAAAVTAFRAAAAGKPYLAYDIRGGVETWIDEQIAKDPDAAAESKAIAAAEKLLSRWTTAATEFVKDAPGEPVTSVFPAYAAQLVNIKAGHVGTTQQERQELTYDELASVLDDLANSSAVSKVATRLAALKSGLPANSATNGWNDADKKTRDDLAQTVRQLIAAANAAEHAADAQALVETLKAAETALTRLPEPQRFIERIAPDGDEAGAGGGPREEPEWRFEAELIQSQFRTLRFWFNEWFVITTSALIAICTAFALLYVGQPWGTWPDRVAMLIWGLGATTFTAEVLASLGTLTRKRVVAA